MANNSYFAADSAGKVGYFAVSVILLLTNVNPLRKREHDHLRPQGNQEQRVPRGHHGCRRA
ncbi:hypothetical protein ARTHRO8AJ_460028 [Arthrobacter sp. 8AJ]|nr:hypothetical protein ARTHRO8AJ_460028 [Arthrobacter sp. 8AJ]